MHWKINVMWRDVSGGLERCGGRCGAEQAVGPASSCAPELHQWGNSCLGLQFPCFPVSEL